ncbi:MAG: hypothetical protein BMS9Abin13_276 [Patescibacteria group bacterium]|nr:MAG: hypothetical protein BMS9Abin13_276 [Patescibacteria group bacterium]
MAKALGTQKPLSFFDMRYFPHSFVLLVSPSLFLERSLNLTNTTNLADLATEQTFRRRIFHLHRAGSYGAKPCIPQEANSRDTLKIIEPGPV